MAQAKQAKEKNQVQLESNRQTQTPPSRQAGNNQTQGLSTTTNASNRGLTRFDPFSSWSPFSLMNSFRTEMDRLFDDFGFGRGLSFPTFGGPSFDWSPQTEVFERGNQLVVRADLPGLTKDDINVDIEGNNITIRGERKSEREENKEGIYRSERSYGSFFRSIPLPDGTDADKAKADFNNGVLEITMPLPARKSTGRRIEIGGK
jgi:HSP20 family protein